MKSRSVTIMLTNLCNLKCIYCYEANKSKREINANIAYSIIDKEMLLDDRYECIEFNLFGGEPFLRFDMIKDIYSYLESKNYNKEWKIGIITNGTVLNEEHKLWLSTHKDRLIITLSIDGTKSMQDRNRNNSFDMLDLDFFVNTFDVAYAKMTISEYTVDALSEGVIFLQNKGFCVNAGIAYGVRATDSFLNKLSEQLDLYYAKMKEESYKDRSSLLRFPYETIYMSKGKHYRTCDAGKVARAYDVDGKEYPCYMFLPASLSENQVDGISEIVFPDINVDEQLLPEQCRSCSIYAVCHNCYCNNYKVRQNIYSIDESMCSISKLMLKKQAEYFAWLWGKKMIILSQENEKMLVDSLLSVLK